jgi:hypothetical protein
MAKTDKSKYAADLIPPTTMMDVVKYKMRTGEFVGMKVMSHGEFKSMEKQPSFRYQEFQKGFSKY